MASGDDVLGAGTAADHRRRIRRDVIGRDLRHRGRRTRVGDESRTRPEAVHERRDHERGEGESPQVVAQRRRAAPEQIREGEHQSADQR